MLRKIGKPGGQEGLALSEYGKSAGLMPTLFLFCLYESNAIVRNQIDEC